MSQLGNSRGMRLVKVGPNLREQVERWVAATHHEMMILRLQRFREQLERDMGPEPWTLLECSAVLLISDVCDALGLLEEEKAGILGPEGMAALRCELALLSGELNDRQLAALTCVREHGEITLGSYRAICPHWSDETLRLDLVQLVEQGLLIKDGAKRGTRYRLAD